MSLVFFLKIQPFYFFLMSFRTLIKAIQTSVSLSSSLDMVKYCSNANATLQCRLSCANSLTYGIGLCLICSLCTSDSNWTVLLCRPFIALFLITFLFTVTIILKSWIAAFLLRANILHHQACKVIKS